MYIDSYGKKWYIVDKEQTLFFTVQKSHNRELYRDETRRNCKNY